jgi:hypothetical protein
MHEAALRNVLLIRAIDEGDKAGEVLSVAERSTATKNAAQSAGEIPNGLAGQSLPVPAERLLVRRAELLMTTLQARSPVITHVLDLIAGASWLAPVLLVVAFACGVGMSALDGRHQIDILAFPLLGLIAWNLAVYLTLIVAALRKRKQHTGGSTLSTLYARWIRERTDALLRQSSRFNVPLAEAMQRFAQEWVSIMRPGLLLRAQRLFHVCAVMLAFGLITGLYARGLVLRYDAGWESTFLDAAGVRALIGLLYGPASWLSGIDLPSVAQLQTLRWKDNGTGASAAPWIHLIALTTVLYIVLPRLLCVVLTTVALWRFKRSPPLPAAFMPYARAILLETGRVRGLTAAVVTYAYQPARDALAGLKALLTDALGSDVTVEHRASVAYGDEDTFSVRLRADPLKQADCQVLLMNMSATPETENHGAMIATMRRALAKQPEGFLVVVDASAYIAKLGADPSLAGRVAERTRTWQEFASAHGQASCVVDLSRLRVGETADPSARDTVRAALQQAANA